jgi:hypothetical protein
MGGYGMQAHHCLIDRGKAGCADIGCAADPAIAGGLILEAGITIVGVDFGYRVAVCPKVTVSRIHIEIVDYCRGPAVRLQGPEWAKLGLRFQKAEPPTDESQYQ